MRKNIFKLIVVMLTFVSLTLFVKVDAMAATNGWVNSNGSWYYINNDGSSKKGWFYNGYDWYYMDYNTGRMITGWASISGKWYYFNNNGAMETGWVYDGAWYYFGNDGAMKVGWVYDNNSWYYLNYNGYMKTGWLEYKGCWYYFNNENGQMKKNSCVLDKEQLYYFNNDGILQQRDPKTFPEFEIIDDKNEDINNDGVKDNIILIGKGYRYFHEEAYIVIKDGRSNKTISVKPVNDMVVSIKSIKDINGDGLKDILIRTSAGHSTTEGFQIFVSKYNDYIEENFTNWGLNYRFVSNFKYMVTDMNSNKSFEVNMDPEKINSLVKFGIYDRYGNLTGKSLGEFPLLDDDKFYDVDGDGVSEFIVGRRMNFTCYGSSTTSVIGVYKYINGEFILQDFYGEAGEYGMLDNLYKD